MQTSIAQQIEQTLEPVEKLRIQTRKNLWNRIPMIWVIGVTIVIYVLFQSPMIRNTITGKETSGVLLTDDTIAIAVASSLVFGLLASTLILIIRTNREFSRKAKDSYIRPMMLSIFPQLVYDPAGKIAQSVFHESGLFRRSFDIHKGDDLFQGIINNRVVEFSELNVYDRRNSSSGSSTSKSVSSGFSGLFMRVETGNSFANRIIIDADRLEAIFSQYKMPAFVEAIIRRLMPDYGPQRSTGIQAFDERFKVYAPDEADVKKLLNPDLTNRLIEIYDKLEAAAKDKKPKNQQAIASAPSLFKLSIHGNSLYFAVSDVGLFNFNLRNSVTSSKEVLVDSIQYIRMLTDIAEAC